MVGVVHDFRLRDDCFAGGPGDVDQEIPGQRSVGIVGQRAQLAGVVEVVRDLGAVGVQHLREIGHQGVEKGPAGRGGRAFQDGAQGAVLVNNPRWDRVSGVHGE